MMRRALILAAAVTLSCGTARAQVYRVAQMNAEQIRALDKQKTAVILPGGILEEHGPHLPSYSDGYMNEWLTERLAEAIVARPGWAVLVFPTIPLGHGGANEIGGRYVYPGTYSVRRATLRAILMDLATELGEQGFRWVFVMHLHGNPYHNLMLDQSGDYFRDTYGGRMVNLFGLEPTPEQLSKLKMVHIRPVPSAAEKEAAGSLDLHAGFSETSRLLFLRPDLVSPMYNKLAPFRVNSPVELFQVAKTRDWPGYFSSPRLARVDYGAKLMEYNAAENSTMALAILDGSLDEQDVPRYATIMLGIKPVADGLEGSTRYEAEVERKQREWMKRKGVK